jgi:hypothetical protein
MLRATLGVIVGYVVMAATVFVTFTIAYLAMGADGAFQPRSYEASTLWLAAALPLSLGAAVAGGFVCAAIAKRNRPVQALAVVTLLLGLLAAIPAMTANRAESDSEPRTGDVGNLEAMKRAKQPTWVALLNPVIGATGVLIGGSLMLRRARPRALQ